MMRPMRTTIPKTETTAEATPTPFARVAFPSPASALAFFESKMAKKPKGQLTSRRRRARPQKDEGSSSPQREMSTTCQPGPCFRKLVHRLSPGFWGDEEREVEAEVAFPDVVIVIR